MCDSLVNWLVSVVLATIQNNFVSNSRSKNLHAKSNFFFFFIVINFFFPFFCSGTELKFYYLPIFQMRSSCWYISLLKCSGIDCYSNKTTNFRKYFSQKFCLIWPKKIGNLILIFEKVQIKMSNAVICGKKLNVCATGNKLVFILALCPEYDSCYNHGIRVAFLFLNCKTMTIVL